MTAKRTVPILVVDDNATKRLALNAVLLPLGYSIVEADSGRAALRCILSQDFAVILLDVCMPTMDGFETAALIRQRRQSESTPIIFITAFSSDEIERTDHYAEGAVDFIFAPVPPQELRAKVTAFANLFVNAETLANRAREMQASADQFRQLTDVAPIGIFQTDSQNNYVYTNPRWSEITGIGADEAVGRKWDIIVDGGKLPGAVFDVAAGVGPEDLGAADQVELRHRFEIRPSGEAPRIVLLTARSIPHSAGGCAGWVGTLTDVTVDAGAAAALSDARDEATEASRLKSDFLANMSHEIRTPMNGIVGMTDLLLETDLDARQRDYAQTVRTSGEVVLTIIDDLLDLSSVDAGRLEVANIGFDVRTVAGDVVNLLAGPAHTNGLELRTVIEDSVPAVVRGDPLRIRQVLTNLVGNAIKFSQSGEIVIRIAESNVVGAGTALRFEVSDTGAGIAPEKLSLILQPFVQAGTSTTRKYGGTGLGLAISGHLVALMGGSCGVVSRLGVGSTFWFTVRADAHTAPTETVPTAPLAGGSVARLLLAEDNLINQKVAVAILSGAGYSVDTVLNGAAAVEAVATQTYDAILMDCQMPEMNGYEATAAIRAQEGSGRRTQIIAMTAGARREDQERCMAEGMDSYLAKPVSKDALLAMVASSVKRARQ